MFTQTNTANLQNQLAGYCRDVKEITLPGARNDKLHHYRRLVYNVVKGIMDDAFPISRKILGEQAWDNIIRKFHAEHDCQTPQVWRLPKELYAYARLHNLADQLNKPWLTDLLLLEWIEIAVYMMQDISPDAYVPLEMNDLASKIFVFNQEYQVIELEYPVHLIAAEKTIPEKGSYYLLVYREPETGRVQFINLNPFSNLLLTALLSKSTLQEWWEDEGKSLNLPAKEAIVLEEAFKFIHLLHKRQFLLGIEKSPS